MAFKNLSFNTYSYFSNIINEVNAAELYDYEIKNIRSFLELLFSYHVDLDDRYNSHVGSLFSDGKLYCSYLHVSIVWNSFSSTYTFFQNNKQISSYDYCYLIMKKRHFCLSKNFMKTFLAGKFNDITIPTTSTNEVSIVSFAAFIIPIAIPTIISALTTLALAAGALLSKNFREYKNKIKKNTKSSTDDMIGKNLDFKTEAQELTPYFPLIARTFVYHSIIIEQFVQDHLDQVQEDHLEHNLVNQPRENNSMLDVINEIEMKEIERNNQRSTKELENQTQYYHDLAFALEESFANGDVNRFGGDIAHISQQLQQQIQAQEENKNTNEITIEGITDQNYLSYVSGLIATYSKDPKNASSTRLLTWLGRFIKEKYMEEKRKNPPKWEPNIIPLIPYWGENKEYAKSNVKTEEDLLTWFLWRKFTFTENQTSFVTRKRILNFFISSSNTTLPFRINELYGIFDMRNGNKENCKSCTAYIYYKEV